MDFFCLTLVAFHWFIIHDGSLSQFFSFFLYFFVPGNWYQNCSLKMLHIVVVWMDGGAFWKLLWRLSIYLWSDYSEVRRKKNKKNIQNKHGECPQQPEEGTICFLKNQTQIISIMWGSAVQNLLSLRNSTRYMWVLFVPRKVLVILWYNIARSTFLPALTVLVRYSKFRIVHIQIDWRVYVVLFNNENSLWIAD